MPIAPASVVVAMAVAMERPGEKVLVAQAAVHVTEAVAAPAEADQAVRPKIRAAFQ